MKNIQLLILILIIGCNESIHKEVGLESEEINNRIDNGKYIPSVKGKILNYSKELDGDLIIEYVSVVPLPRSQETKTTTINSDGEFKLEIERGLPYQQIWLSIGDFYYGGILANKDLQIIADISKLRKDSIQFYGDGIEFTGTDAQANLFVNQYYNFERPEKKELNIAKRKVKRNRDIPIEEKVKKTKGFYNEMKAIDEKYINKTSSEFAWILENERQSELYGDLFVLHWGKEMDSELMKECISHEPKLISNASTSYYSYLKTFMSNSTREKRFEGIKKVLKKNISDKSTTVELNKFLETYEKRIQGKEYDKEAYRSGVSQFMNKYEKELYESNLDLFLKEAEVLPDRKSSIMKLIGAPEDIWKREQYLEKVIPTTSLEWCRKIMRENLESDKERITEITNLLKEKSKIDTSNVIGENIVNLENGVNLFVSNHEDIESLLRSIREKNKGKAVILDIWATWCGPCISDMNRSKEVRNELKKLPVEVIYLCVESRSSIDKWKNKVAELSVSGDHVFLNKNLSSEIMEFFKLSGYPSHIFIDKEGNYDPDLISSISRMDIEGLKKKL